LEKSINENDATYERILLLTHEELRTFYEKAGFVWLGPSNVRHGSRAWFEMRRDLTLSSRPGLSAKDQVEIPEQMIQGNVSLPLNILEALRRPEDRVPTGRLISDFHHALSDLLEVDDSRPGNPVNKFDLLCPRLQCGSIILKRGVGRWVERSGVQVRLVIPNGRIITLSFLYSLNQKERRNIRTYRPFRLYQILFSGGWSLLHLWNLRTSAFRVLCKL
jgi:hypothetical protein